MNAIGSYDDLDMHGIDPRWYEVVVRREWQDEIRKLDPALRILWDQRCHQWAIVFKNESMLTDYCTGQLVGWALVIRFPPDMDVDGMLANMSAMADRNAYATPEQAIDAAEKKAEALEEKRRADLVERDGEMFEEVDKNIDVLGRDLFRKESRQKDNQFRAHAHGKLLVPVHLAAPSVVGGSA